jgi:hypothetical protein
MCQRDSCEEKQMIDWTKPLETEKGNKVYYIGLDPRNTFKVVLVTHGGSYFSVYKDTGYDGPNKIGLCVVNSKEPWEKAWDHWQGQPAEQDYSVKQTFKEAFQLGYEAGVKK